MKDGLFLISWEFTDRRERYYCEKTLVKWILHNVRPLREGFFFLLSSVAELQAKQNKAFHHLWPPDLITRNCFDLSYYYYYYSGKLHATNSQGVQNK